MGKRFPQKSILRPRDYQTGLRGLLDSIDRKLANVETGTRLLIGLNRFQDRQLVKQATRVLEVIALLEVKGITRERFTGYVSEAQAILSARKKQKSKGGRRG
jgi:hypothetical protein